METRRTLPITIGHQYLRKNFIKTEEKGKFGANKFAIFFK
jgi:hypothetical protein